MSIVNHVNGEEAPSDEDYVKLEASEPETSTSAGGGSSTSDEWGWWSWWWWWAKIAAAVLLLVVLAAVFFKWIAPFLMEKEIIPIMNWERKTFSTGVLGLLVFISIALLPTIFIPTKPSMWVAGMTFGYGYGFLLVTAGLAIGTSIPFFIGKLFYSKIHAWLERHPKEAFVIRLGGAGTWFSQFQVVALIRVSPFPHILYNYCAVATDVKYGPYLLGTLVGMLPDIFLGLYTGVLIKALANASYSGGSMSILQMVVDVGGFCIVVAAAVLITMYAKRRLEELQMQENLLLQ